MRVLCFIQLHLVHWNATRFPSFSEAVKSDGGICVLTVFIEVGQDVSVLASDVKSTCNLNVINRDHELPITRCHVCRCRLVPNTWHLRSCAVSCSLWNTLDNPLKFQTVFSRQICYQVSVDSSYKLYMYNSRLFVKSVTGIHGRYSNYRVVPQCISGPYCSFLTS